MSLQDINVMLSVLGKSIVLTAIGISLNYTVFVYILCLIKLKKSVVKKKNMFGKATLCES